MYPGDIPFPGAANSKGVAGRPKKVGQPIVLPQPNEASGWEYSTDFDPSSVSQAYGKYLKSGQMPPGLAPRRVTTNPMNTLKRNAISRGFRKPRSISDGS